jgi:hypothetical protein
VASHHSQAPETAKSPQKRAIAHLWVCGHVQVVVLFPLPHRNYRLVRRNHPRLPSEVQMQHQSPRRVDSLSIVEHYDNDKPMQRRTFE